MNEVHLQTAQRVANRFAQLPDVEAVAVAGSQMSGTAGPNSDIDVYIYSHAKIPVEVRTAIGAEFSDHVEIVDYWGPGNEWDDRATGVHVDAVFWTVGWIEDQLDRTLNRHQAWTGYTTCFWHTVQISNCLFDRAGWFSRLQQIANQPYPDALVKAIVELNRPLLRSIAPSYLRQLEKAAARQDLVSLNHRATALLASYFDILFAINQQPHPGEKRLIAFAERHCPKRPAHMREDIEALLLATVHLEYSISDAVNRLVDHLDELLRREGLPE
ncbi:MAG: nucleotidyltransferase domain-containing protein [Anaerolineae bacterium]|nr:nucleotidyltransferase domain-containing protein [Anaerolineae bacterium]